MIFRLSELQTKVTNMDRTREFQCYGLHNYLLVCPPPIFIITSADSNFSRLHKGYDRHSLKRATAAIIFRLHRFIFMTLHSFKYFFNKNLFNASVIFFLHLFVIVSVVNIAFKYGGTVGFVWSGCQGNYFPAKTVAAADAFRKISLSFFLCFQQEFCQHCRGKWAYFSLREPTFNFNAKYLKPLFSACWGYL